MTDGRQMEFIEMTRRAAMYLMTRSAEMGLAPSPVSRDYGCHLGGRIRGGGNHGGGDSSPPSTAVPSIPLTSPPVYGGIHLVRRR
uniref:Uncharacterized protein n=1 Tax=Oryza rufipogon TaxID=4529 RepID=A0A0E0NS78_ORYRU